MLVMHPLLSRAVLLVLAVPGRAERRRKAARAKARGRGRVGQVVLPVTVMQALPVAVEVIITPVVDPASTGLRMLLVRVAGLAGL